VVLCSGFTDVQAMTPTRRSPPAETFVTARRQTRGRIVMNYLITRLQSLVRRDEGQDLIEYAMLVALIALFSVVAVTAAGGKVVDVFNAIVAAIPS
jgi:Flp pilus assembly pilin Flp